MFVSAIMVCGLTSANPMITEGCGIVTSRALFATEQECVYSQMEYLPELQAKIPSSAYVADIKCVEMTDSSEESKGEKL